MGFVSNILTILYTILFAVLTVGLTLLFSFTNSADISSSMVVLTGHRTRDWSAPNSYSMHSASEDHHTRLYSCMIQAGITRENFGSTLGEFRLDAKAHYNCGLESDMGWPRDYGFLRCLQNHFDATYHQSNVFLKCLDLSEGVMVESIQSRNSGLFLGSYNFVALQMASMAVITAFLIFTAGGAWNNDGTVTTTVSGHISGVWKPLSTFNVNYALIWSFFILGSSLFYTFPMRNTWSDIPAVDDRNAFPTTPWGGYFCSMVFLAMFGFFFSYFLEWYSTTTGFCGSGAKQEDSKVAEADLGYVQPQQKSVRYTPSENIDGADPLQGPSIAPFQNSASSRIPSMRPPSMRPQSQNVPFPPSSGSGGKPGDFASLNPSARPPLDRGSFNAPSSYGSARGNAPSAEASSRSEYGQSDEYSGYDDGTGYESSNEPRRNFDPAGGAFSGSRRASSFNASTFSANKFYKKIPTRNLGIIANTNNYLNYDEQVYTSNIMLPFITKAFACTWVFSDSLLFVGMLNTQNSLLTENVVTVCYYIFLCRAFQLAATFFIDKVVFEPEILLHAEMTTNQDFGMTHNMDSRQKTHQPNIVAACCQLCSFWCYSVVLLHFLNSFYLPYSLNLQLIGGQTYAAQLTFVIIMTIMELAKHSLVFYSVLIKISPEKFAMASKIIYLVDCIARAVFVLTTCIVVTNHLGNLNLLLYNNLKT